MKKILSVLFTIFTFSLVFAQEALKSVEEEYFNYLSLQGLIDAPTLGYRTLSDSVWNLTEDVNHTWKSNNLGTTKIIWEDDNQGSNWFSQGFYHGFKYRLYGPEWFNSFNSSIPFGQNDGILWQGKGYNTSLTSGARLEAFGLELTLKPQIAWMQNQEFEYITPSYQYPNFADKASLYGYYGVRNIDAPQRFGDSSFFSYSLGDSEIRYTYHNITVGFGTQSIWLGPAYINPIIHSNNAAPYPKLDIGLRKTDLIVPYFGWDLGKVEFRGWWGKVTESDYFDNDESNDSNIIAGMALYYSFPGIFEGLTLGFNRTMLSKWDNIDKYALFKVFGFKMESHAGFDENDQRASVTMDWKFPSVGTDIYIEWAKNDYSPNKRYIIRYPFHTEGWTVGLTKVFDVFTDYKLVMGIELTNLESSRDYANQWPTSFYAHHIITQGYTNRGQWLGAGIGTGGNSQTISFKFIYPKGDVKLFVNRTNPDLDYIWYFLDNEFILERGNRTYLTFGLSNTTILMKNLYIQPAVSYTQEYSPDYDRRDLDYYRPNINGSLLIKYNF